MKLALIGNYGATNVGDDAILESILRDMGGHEVIVFSANPNLTERQFGVRSVWLFPLGFRSFLRGNFWKTFRSLRSADAVILGGGGLFQDDRLYACFLWAWQVFWVKWLKKPLFIWATGVGPLKTRLGKGLAAWAYRYARFVTVRDKASYDLLLKIGISPERLHCTADPVFSHQPSSAGERKKGLCLVSVRPWLQFTPALLEAFSRALAEEGMGKPVELVWVVMQDERESDSELFKVLQKELGGEVFAPKTFSELLFKTQEAEMAIGMRYHFLIAALLTRTPCIPVSYSPKVEQLFRATCLESHVIPVQGASAERLAQGMRFASQNYGKVQSELSAIASKMSSLAGKNKEIFDRFLKTVDPKPL